MDLSLVTIEEISDELQKRGEAFLLVLSKNQASEGINELRELWFWGPQSHVLGLAEYARGMVWDNLRSQRVETNDP